MMHRYFLTVLAKLIWIRVNSMQNLCVVTTSTVYVNVTLLLIVKRDKFGSIY